MAKNRNKKNKAKKGGGGVAAMDTSEGGPVASTPAEAPEPMDTSEGKQPSSTSTVLGSINNMLCVSLTRKIKKGVQMKRSQNARKMKAIARAVSKNEQCEEKMQKAKRKKTRI
ncbi:uncharacterized protein LOC120661681 isoform X1 [Panicum virgatum]|uniref:uncharacterized protein LOC120661681 isoform X1 n=1 Tax=Panicum virgatum TaxID=38727 RepID=UPI0019D55CEE|nr:uncharacterized protein LOC120661681 isoform X1 [Panicum virgatum]